MINYILQNANTNILHDEFIKAGIVPIDVFTEGTNSIFNFNDNEDTIAIQIVIDAHDPLKYRIVCDENGFILHCCNDVFCSFPIEGMYQIYFVNELPDSIKGQYYKVPTHRYLNEEIVEVSDYNDYKLSVPIWADYIKFNKENLINMLQKNPLNEVRALFHSMDEQQKLMFRKCFSEYWGGNSATQTDINLSFESMFRILFKTLYIKDVLKRDLTEAEQLTYENLLTIMNSHDASIDPYLPLDQWALPLTERIMDDINNIRFNKIFPLLSYITTPDPE